MKPLSFVLLKILADGQFHSGETLARELGLSRGSIWNALQNLDRTGLKIYKVRGRGYRLSLPFSLLDVSEINKHLAGFSRFFSLELRDFVPSTNTMLLSKATQNAVHGSVLIAEWQTSGRGRLGRSWHIGIGEGLTFSLLWHFKQGVSTLSGLSLAVSIAIARALKFFGVEGVQLKWPNDVLWHYRKLAGILIEISGDTLGPSAVVIGVGLNTKFSEHTKSAIDQATVDLAEMGHEINRNALVARVLVELKAVLDLFSRQGFSVFKQEWQNLHALQNREISLNIPSGERATGTLEGVDDEGALLLRVGSRLRSYRSGEVSLATRLSARIKS